MSKAYIAFGSNKGDKIGFIQKAFETINEDHCCKIIAVSSIYETKPFGKKKQNNFYNGVFILETKYDLIKLFLFLKSVENIVGRTPSERWGPREIDLDILFFDNVIYEDEKLKIPHKGILERDFVLIPLIELNENLVHPEFKIKLSEVDFSKIEKNILGKVKT